MLARAETSAGYALLEILVVLAIMALIAAVALPATLGQVAGLTLDADARTLASNLRRLREQAADLQVDIIVTPPAARGNALPVSDGSLLSLSWGTAATVAPARDGTRRFTLGWDGTMSGTIILERGNRRMRLAADPVTGRLRVEPAG